MINKINKKRRYFLILVTIGFILLVGSIITFTSRKTYLKSLLQSKHTKGTQDNSAFDPEVISTLTVFIGTYFAAKMDESDHNDIKQRLEYATSYDNNWRKEYTWLANYLKDLSLDKFDADYKTLSDKQRSTILESMVSHSVWGRKSQIRAIISSEERERRLAYKSTIPHLIKIYRFSGVPWKNRGYTSWPGIPGDTFDYTTPGPSPQC